MQPLNDTMLQQSRRQFFGSSGLRFGSLAMAMMASGRSVGWEWNLASGRDYWYGDLRTMFGILGDTWSGHTDEFFGYVHRDDRERVSQAVTDARVNHKP